MDRKQTRRSISLSGKSYKHLKDYCKAKGISMSLWLETQVHKLMDSKAFAKAMCQLADRVPEMTDEELREEVSDEEVEETRRVVKNAVDRFHREKKSETPAQKNPIRGGGTHLL